MSDLSRHLPLSARPRVDESGVSGDWRTAVADVVASAAALEPTSAAAAARFLAVAGLDREFAGLPLAEVATAVRTGSRRRIRVLADALRALLELAGDRAVAIPPVIGGAVALYASTRMPFERRAALSGTAVHATDAEWTFGRGPVREAPAREILDFVLGLSDTPPPAPTR
ncbi:hypothetical protein AB3M83_06400 [Microbacterium sp. 179-B 1A2 NHS]|uniref:hypothetical protein n=1 Tax=Microbacterium sp. 179-B 1A2 NHS TaxID=3142383 RepID=UPI0039A1E0A4